MCVKNRHWIEERVAWRDTEKMQAPAHVELAKIRAEAEEKKRADEIQAEEKCGQVRSRCQDKADKELTLKEMEMKTQSYPDIFTDMPRETDMIQHRVKLTDDTLIGCKPYLSIAVCHEGRAME